MKAFVELTNFFRFQTTKKNAVQNAINEWIMEEFHEIPAFEPDLMDFLQKACL